MGAPYIRETLLDSPRVANLGRCHAYLGVSQHVTERFPFTLFVTDKWVKCYCELILGVASLVIEWGVSYITLCNIQTFALNCHLLFI